ncbi:MAG: hypothetical protein KGY54_07745, partial [Oleiphilaceae bacterium]|nr:hypothetical protein [Oleiphilaceae bacterium]
MTIRNLFIVAVSTLLALIMIVASAFIGWQTRSTISTEVVDQRDRVAGDVLRILSVTDDLMAKRVQSSLSLLTERGNELGVARIDGSETVANTDVSALYLGDTLVNNN